MITKNPMQLKAFVKNKAAEKHISAQLVMQNYMLERLLERTTQKHGSGVILTDYPEIMKELRESNTLRKQWEKYSREYEYAKDAGETVRKSL